MATGQFYNPPLRHISRVSSSGTFVIPQTVSKVFVTVTGARGGRSTTSGGADSGAAISAGGFVEVLPGSTAQLLIGAGGVNGTASGTAGGSTTFDGAITVTSSNGGSYDTRYGAQTTGSTGSRSDTSSLPSGSPDGAIARVSGTSTTGPNGDIATAGSGIINIYA